MPAAICEEIHEKAKVIAIQVGYREAARQLEISENTICTWAAREGWSAQAQAAQAAQLVKIERQGMKAAATKSSGEIIAGFKGKTQLSLAKVVDKTATGLKRKTPDQLVNCTGAVLNAVSAYAKLHDNQPSGNHVTMQVLNQISVPPAIP